MRVRSLTRSLPAIVRSAAGARHLLVFLDFDGTLAPFETDPDAAYIPSGAMHWLRKLTANPRATVGIISGRATQDLISRIGIEEMVYAGNHGIEIRGRGLHFAEPFAFLLEPVLAQILANLGNQLEGLPYARIENKRLTATVHTRGASDEERMRAAEIVLRTVHEFPQFHCRAGRHAVDILPHNGWHKGTAAQWIRRELGLDDALVVYAGDDVSDEDAFEALPGAITIKVGVTPTQACYLASSPSEIWALVAHLENAATIGRPDADKVSAVTELR